MSSPIPHRNYLKPHHVLTQFDKTHLLDSINNVKTNLFRSNLNQFQKDYISNSLNTLVSIIKPLQHTNSEVSQSFRRLIQGFEALIDDSEDMIPRGEFLMKLNSLNRLNSTERLARPRMSEVSLSEASVTRENVSGIFDTP